MKETFISYTIQHFIVIGDENIEFNIFFLFLILKLNIDSILRRTLFVIIINFIEKYITYDI